MNDAAFCGHAVKLEFVKGQRIHEGEQVLLFLDGEEAGLENEALGDFANRE
jgi:hypothetical protein